MVERMIVVDENDNELGIATRKECHTVPGKLHRAYVIFLFDEAGRLFIQRRVSDKIWGGYWDCSVAGHVYPGETYESGASRRLGEELGIEAPLEYVTKFMYEAHHDSENMEKEICAILTASTSSAPQPNPEEISDAKFIPEQEIEEGFQRSPDEYTPWFKLGYETLKHKRELG